jgi:L-2-amino-thiazoline-4-carboxylic acid hydrolase-like protein
MHGIGLDLHFSESMIHHVTNRDNSDEPPALDYGKMAKFAGSHPLHDLVDRVGWSAGLDLARHHLFDRLVAKPTCACISGVAGLVDAIKARAMFYYAFYKEFSAEIGSEITAELMKRAIYKRGLEIGKRFAKFAPDDMEGLKTAFLDFIPDPQGTFNPKLERCDPGGIDILLQSCPLKEAWQQGGLSDQEVATMCSAGRVDNGTFEGANFAFHADTWRPGREGCCHLHISPGK